MWKQLGEKDVYPWVEEIEETGFIYDSQKRDEDFTKRIVGINKELDNFGNRSAHIPIVTGYFEIVDMFSSVLPKVVDIFFSITYESYTMKKPGDRTFTDLMILTVLKDKIEAQKDEENVSSELGYAYQDLYDIYIRYLRFIDLYIEIKNKFEALKFFDKIVRHNLSEGFKIFTNLAFNLILNASDDLIKSFQVYSPKFKIGGDLKTDPSHSQLTKDVADHLLNLLAGKIAIEAVFNTTKIIDEKWKLIKKTPKVQTRTIEESKKQIDLIAEVYFSHPVEQNFSVPLLKNFKEECLNYIKKYPEKIELAKSKDMIDYMHKTFQKFDFETEMEKHIQVLEYFKDDNNFNDIDENIKKARSTTNLDG